MNRQAPAIALAALLALGLLAVPTPAPAQSLVASPLVVESIEFPDGMPFYTTTDPHDEDEERIDNPRDVVVTVANTGTRTSTDYQVFYYWETPDGERVPLNGQEPYSITDGEGLEADDSEVHTLTWHLDRSQDQLSDEPIPVVGEGKVVVEVHEFTVTTDEVDAFVALHDYHVALQDPDGQQRTIGPDETIRVPFAVHTHGNVDETLTWAITDAHARLDVAFDDATTQHLLKDRDAEGQNGRNVLVVTYPFDGVLDDLEDLVVRVSATDQAGLTRHAETLSIDVRHDRTPPTPGIDLQGPTGTVHAPTGQDTVVSYTLTNTGEASDVYALASNVDGGWLASDPKIGSTVPDRVSLGPDESATIDVAVRPPVGADTLARLVLSATSDAGATATATTHLQISGPRPAITGLTLGSAPVYQGDELTARVAYKNVGDQRLSGASLTATLTYADGTQQSDTVALGALEGGHRRTVPVDLGEATGSGAATLTATIQASNPAQETSNVFVRLADLTVTPPQPLVSLAGETVRYHLPPHAFQVHNGGNADEPVTLAVTGATLEGASRLVLGPGETRTVAVTQAVPGELGDATHLAVTLTATLDDSPARTSSAAVETPVQDELEPVVAWSDVPERLQAYKSSPVRLVVTDDTLVDAAWIDVEPLPDQDDVSVAYKVPLFESNDQWVSRLHAGAAGLYALTPRAVDAYGNEASGPTRVLNVTTAPVPEAPPGPDVELLLQNATAAGAAVLVTTDAPGATLVRYRVDDGTERTAPLVDGEALLELALEPGSHDLVVLVDQGGVTTERNLTVDVPEPIQGSPGALGKLTPAPGAGLLVVALATLALLRRRP